MKILKRKKHGISFITVWYAEERIKQSGVIQYRQASFQGENAIPFYTLVTDLTESEEEIITRFSKSCKYKINRAPREGITIEIKAGKEISEQEIKEFIEFFANFWETKGVKLSEKEGLLQELLQYRDAEALTISKAMVQGETVVYHTHVMDEIHARLLHSASLFRLEETVSKNVVGFANRYLHKEEILYFKNVGKEKYDWGGAGEEDDVIEITRFKESFGGQRETQYNFEEKQGVLAKLFGILIKLR